MYYGVISVSVMLFGIMFLFSKQYEKQNGNGLPATFTFILIYSIVGAFVLLAVSGFRIAFTPFTLLMAFITAINHILCSYCSLKALGKINLSMYAILSMLGGMMLPFLFGVMLYNEPVTLGKTVCVIFVAAALLLTLTKSNTSGGFRYYIGIFFFNGMSGVLSTLFQKSPFCKTVPSVYSFWSALLTALFAAAVLWCVRKQIKRPAGMAIMWSAGYGFLNHVANYLLLLALAVLPSSVQYPFVTGGVMIVSTVISALIGQNPSVKEVVSVALSFIGIIALVFIP